MVGIRRCCVRGRLLALARPLPTAQVGRLRPVVSAKSSGLERLIEVGDQVFRVLDADRQPNERV